MPVCVSVNVWWVCVVRKHDVEMKVSFKSVNMRGTTLYRSALLLLRKRMANIGKQTL